MTIWLRNVHKIRELWSHDNNLWCCFEHFCLSQSESENFSTCHQAARPMLNEARLRTNALWVESSIASESMAGDEQPKSQQPHLSKQDLSTLVCILLKTAERSYGINFSEYEYDQITHIILVIRLIYRIENWAPNGTVAPMGTWSTGRHFCVKWSMLELILH